MSLNVLESVPAAIDQQEGNLAALIMSVLTVYSSRAVHLSLLFRHCSYNKVQCLCNISLDQLSRSKAN